MRASSAHATTSYRGSNLLSLSGLETNKTNARNMTRLVLASENLVQCNFLSTFWIIT